MMLTVSYWFICTWKYKYRKCWNLIVSICFVSHPQCGRIGFSINKEGEVENLKKVSLISQRQVYDHAMSRGTPLTEFTVSNSLVKSRRLAHSQFVKAIRDFKKAKVIDEKNWKQNLKMNEIAEVTEKKQAVESCIKSLEPDIDSYSIAAEDKSDLSLLAKGNSFCHTLRKNKELILHGVCQIKEFSEIREMRFA